MNRIEKAFRNTKPFIGFVVGGDGGVEYSTKCCLNLIEGGVDILEIGMPFSDPCADGVVIESAAKRSLQYGTKPSTLLEMGNAIRKRSDVAMVFFTYFNPLLQQGLGFLKEIKKAGFDAVLVVDLPAPVDVKNHPFFDALEEAGLDSIFLVTPSTDEVRLKKLGKIAKGFLYYACRKGTTGVRDKLPSDLESNIEKIRKATSLPIAIGFGIADRDSAKFVINMADSFVIGSAFVKLMEASKAPSSLKELAESIDPR